jgi:hypothetical protein
MTGGRGMREDPTAESRPPHAAERHAAPDEAIRGPAGADSGLAHSQASVGVGLTNDGLVRLIDEGCEYYLFNRGRWAFVELPEAVRRQILALQRAS